MEATVTKLAMNLYRSVLNGCQLDLRLFHISADSSKLYLPSIFDQVLCFLTAD